MESLDQTTDMTLQLEVLLPLSTSYFSPLSTSIYPIIAKKMIHSFIFKAFDSTTTPEVCTSQMDSIAHLGESSITEGSEYIWFLKK